ncbi:MULTISPECIES: hypothetical protein [unclassified Mycobacterium]|uniref:hypothetical protein n=1 Tax=unclassified Mycobacterium TaxID=2642494 RepID=UPI001E5234D4|nr:MULTISPECIES: hypothetical protein [unclassified Mycobacterium]
MNDTAPNRGGPSLLLLSALCVAVLFGGIAVGIALGGVMPLPYGPAAAVAAYVRAEPVAVRVIAVATFASSIPLAAYTATVSVRLRRLGAAGPGAAVALTGGVLAAGALGLCGLLAWPLSRPEVAGDATVVDALYLLVFLVGGPGHIVALGLMVAGIAGPALSRGLLPSPVAWAGLGIAALAEAATAVLVWPALGVILPVARVSALCWLVLAAALLPLRRNDIAD